MNESKGGRNCKSVWGKKSNRYACNFRMYIHAYLILGWGGMRL